MKTTILSNILKLTHAQRARKRKAELLAGLLFATAVSNATVIDDFNGAQKWSGTNDLSGSGLINFGVADQQLLISADFKNPANPENPLNTFGNVYYSLNLPMRQRQTLELHTDLVRANQDNVLTYLVTMSASGGEYVFGKGQKEILLLKWAEKDGFSAAFWEPLEIKNQDVVMILTLTPLGDRLLVGTKILDKLSQKVLFERTVVDGPGSEWIVPNPAPHGWKILNPDVGRPYQDDLVVVGLGMHHLTEGQQGRVELRLDNLEYDTYPSPYLGAEKAICLSWPENTAEEQIVVGASSLASNAVWTPWPEPIFKRQGQLCVAVPTTSAQQFFKLVPGTQFSDDFDAFKQPFTSRDDWMQWFLDRDDASRFTFTVLNGCFQIATAVLPLTGQVAVFPPGGGAILGDFFASVDILDWASSRESALGFVGRVQGGPGGVDNGYVASLRMNPSAGTGQLWFFSGESDVQASGVFSVDSNSDYRLEFSAIGNQLELRLRRLAEPQTVVAQGRLKDSRFTQGRVALWVNTRGSTGYSRTLDNFFVTGTTP
jgi:hypothetical protein